MAKRPRASAVQGARLFLRRSEAHAGLLATLGLATCVLSGLLVGLTGYLSASATAGAREVLAAAAPTASGYRFVVDAGEDARGRQAAGDAVVDRRLEGLPATATRLYRSAPLKATAGGEPVTVPTGGDALLTLAAGSELPEHTRLASGRWPAMRQTDAGPAEAALQARAAEALGLRPGDELALEHEGSRLPVRLVGTWEPADAADPFWFSDAELLTGEGDATADGARVFGPLLLAAIPEASRLLGEGSTGEQEATGEQPGPDAGSPAALPGRLEWTMLPDAARLTAGDLQALVAAAGDIQRSLAADPVVAERASVQGELDRTQARVARAQSAIRGVTPVGLILVALIGAIALGQVSRLLVRVRRGDTALLRSRGATAARLVTHSLLEAIAACTAGASVGAVLAHLLLLRLYGATGVLTTVLVAATVAAGGVAIVAGVGAGELLRGRAPAGAGGPGASAADTSGPGTDDAGDSRARTVVALGSVVLATVAAALATGQLLLYGSPLVADAAGRVSVDPLALLAPALGLVAASLLLLAGATPLARLVERLTARGRRLQPWFSARQVSRGLARYAAAGLVIALATGSLTLAASYSGTWSSLGHRTELLRVGADQRIVLHEGRPALAGTEPVLAEPYRRLEGVESAAPALVGRFLLSEGIGGVLTALPASRMPLVMTDAGGAVDLAGLAERLPAGAPLGLPVPEGALSMTLHGILEAVAPNREGPVAPRARIDGTVWLENADGALLASPFGPFELAPDERRELSATTRLPDADGGWRVVAVDVGAVASVFWAAELRVTGFTATDAAGAETALPFAGTDWTSQLALAGVGSQGMVPTSTFRSDGEGFAIGLSLRYGDRSGARAMAVSEAAPLAGRSSYAGTVDPLPVAISRSLARAAFLDEGEEFAFRVPGTSADVACVVVGILPNVPGAAATPAILADLLSLDEHLLRTSELVPVAGEVWLATAGPPVDASAITGPGVRSSSPGGSGSAAVTATAGRALWLAASGCLLLAILSLGAVVLAVSGARSAEFAVLRAVGLRASAQARARLGETLTVAGAAVLAGILAGGLVSWLTVPGLARSVVLDVPEGIAVPVEPALAAWGAILALLLVAILAVCVVQAATAARAARGAVPGREAR